MNQNNLKQKLIGLWNAKNNIFVERTYITDDQYHLKYGEFLGSEVEHPLIIVVGLAQTFWQWIEFVSDLREGGYLGPIYVLDNRGQGLSGRIDSKKSQTAGINSFDTYADDASQFIKFIKSKYSRDPFVIGHSMGAAIVTFALLKKQVEIKKFLAINPMYAIKHKGISRLIPEALLLKIAFILRYAVTDMRLGGSDVANMLKNTVRKDALTVESAMDFTPAQIDPSVENTSSIERAKFSHFVKIKTNAEITKITPQWIYECIRASRIINFEAYKLNTQKILLIISSADEIVDNKKIKKVVRTMKNAKLFEIKNAYHMLFEEEDSRRCALIEKTIDFFVKRS